MKIKYLIAFALILIAWTYVCEWYHGKFDKKEIKSDTTLVVKWDTVHDTLPEIRYEKKIKYISVPDSIFITDTITKEKVLPIVQKKYTDDSTYTAYVSGLRYDIYPRLDSVIVRQKIIERTITNNIYRNRNGLKVKMRPAIGGGYDPLNRQWGVYVGGAVLLDW